MERFTTRHPLQHIDHLLHFQSRTIVKVQCRDPGKKDDLLREPEARLSFHFKYMRIDLAYPVIGSGNTVIHQPEDKGFDIRMCQDGLQFPVDISSCSEGQPGSLYM